MSGFQHQTHVLLTEAGEHIVGHPSVNTIRRWAGRGVRGVRLRTWLIGGRRYTSVEAVAQFVAALSGFPNDTLATDSSATANGVNPSAVT
jgi:hypothetical protein